MQALETLSIDLPADMAATVRQAVQSGEYMSPSDAVQDALLTWTIHRGLHRVDTIEELRTILQEADHDDSVGLDPEAVFHQLEAKYEALAKAEQH